MVFTDKQPSINVTGKYLNINGYEQRAGKSRMSRIAKWWQLGYPSVALLSSDE